MALLYEGKAKQIYATEDPEVVKIAYKDDATAFNGEKTSEITGKGELNNAITSHLFQVLAAEGVLTHFIEKHSRTEHLAKKVRIIPLEIVVRNVAAGSLARRIGWQEGKRLPQTIVECYYKDDALGDPLLNEEHIAILEVASTDQLAHVKQQAKQVNKVLTAFFQQVKVDLIDFKLEFGLLSDGTLCLADEISPDTCRLWDADTQEPLDKDVFRKDIGDLPTAYQKILQRIEEARHV